MKKKIAQFVTKFGGTMAAFAVLEKLHKVHKK